MDPEPYAVYAVELSSFQLHYTSSMSAHAAAVLNVAEDHLDWYVGPDGMADYAADKGRIYDRVQLACVYNVADPVTEQLVRDADVVEGARAIGFTLGTPGLGHGRPGRGRARRPGLRRGARALAPPSCARWPTWPRPAPHFVANALAAAALARSRRRAAEPRCATGCAPSPPTATGSPRSPRSPRCATSTTPRPPTRTPPPSSLQAYEPVVWVAGGLAKGATFDDLVAAGARPAAGRRAPGPRPRGDRRGAFATRARCPGDRSRRRGHFCHGPRGRGGRGARPARRHRAARPRMRFHGHVRELRRSRGCLRRVGPPARRPVSHPGFPADAPHGQEGSA